MSTTTTEASTSTSGRDTTWIIDGDGHVVEPDDMWDRFLPEAFRTMAPRLGAGEPPQRDVSASTAKMLSVKGGRLPDQRLPDMDVDLIDKAVLFPTLGLLIENVTEPEPAAAMHRAVNDWMAEYCAYDRERLIGAAALPSTNADDALSEARRCIDELGYRVVFRHPYHPGTLPIHDRSFEPLWGYLESANVTLTCHSGAPPVYCVERYQEDGFMASHVIHFVNEAMMALTSLILYGVLERHPGLRVGLVEAGATWAPSLCHRLDEHVEKAAELPVHYSLPANVELSLKPSEYFRRQCFVTCEEVEPGLTDMLEAFPHNVLFATDYPHPDGVFPGSTAPLLHATEITDVQRTAILRDNALRNYGLSLAS